MNAYSEDLRMKIVEALERGMGKSQTARTFSVSLSSVKRYCGLAEEGRSLAPKKRPGSKPKLDERSGKLLEEDLRERPLPPACFIYLWHLCGERFIEPVEGALVKERASLGLAVIARPFGIVETNQLLRTA
jgi:transposase